MSENFGSESLPGRAQKRARDADREEVIALLDGAFADGQLDGIEHRERVSRVLRATDLRELETPLADLQVRTPSFLMPAPVPPPATPRKAPPAAQPPRAPSPPPRTAPASARSTPPGGSTDPTSLAVLKVVGSLVVAVVVIAIIASIANQAEDDGPTGFGGAKARAYVCDSTGSNCRDSDGNRVPDPPRERPLINGPALVGNPMASSNIRTVFESMTNDLKPASAISLTIDRWSADAEVVQSDDRTKIRKWTLRDGKWRSSTGDDRDADTDSTTSVAVNLDRVIAMIADPPGVNRVEREPTGVKFAPSAVSITYQGPNETTPTLVLTPEGTVVP